MAESRDFAPHITNKNNSPLEYLIMSALRRFGDFHASSVDGEVIMMFLEFANQILDEVRRHPYWDSPGDADKVELNYYVHPSDIRPVNDNIIIAGLLFLYAVQQGSDKLSLYGPAYYHTLNQELWDRLNIVDKDGAGGGNTPIRLRVVDDDVASTTRKGKRTSPITGQYKAAS